MMKGGKKEFSDNIVVEEKKTKKIKKETQPEKQDQQEK